MRFILMGLCCVLLLFQGCSTSAVQAPIPNLSKVRFNSSLPIEITSINQRYTNGLLEVEVILNSTSQYFQELVAYKIEWYDQDGFMLKNLQANRYKHVFVEPKRDLVIKEIATDNRACDFVIYFENLKQRSIP